MPPELAELTVERVLRAARAARASAYAPYSGFAVGAAVLAEDGRVFAGCNVENASYGLAVCAERNAVAAAIAAGARRFLLVAVVTPTITPAAPCGACRQVLAEFGDAPVVLEGVDGAIERTTVAQLLPAAFGPRDLDAAPPDHSSPTENSRSRS